MMRERLQYGCRSAHSPGEIHSPGLYVHQAVDQSLPALQCVPLAWTLHLPRVDQPYLSNRICQGTMASCSHPHQHCHGMHPAASNMLQGLLAYTIISARPVGHLRHAIWEYAALQPSVSPHVCCLVCQCRLFCRTLRCKDSHSSFKYGSTICWSRRLKIRAV